MNNKVIVIAGASSGIGHATALACAQSGASLVLAARGVEALDRVAQECERFGAEVLIVPTDMTDAAAVDALKHAAIDRFGHIDVWINIVGVGAVGLFDQTPIGALGHFRSQRRGALIQMISIGGWVPSPYAAAYSAAKFGLRGLTEALRAEMSDLPDVHVCAVYPTLVDTPGISHGANYTGRNLKPPPPLLDPRVVAPLVDRRCVEAGRPRRRQRWQPVCALGRHRSGRWPSAPGSDVVGCWCGGAQRLRARLVVVRLVRAFQRASARARDRTTSPCLIGAESQPAGRSHQTPIVRPDQAFRSAPGRHAADKGATGHPAPRPASAALGLP